MLHWDRDDLNIHKAMDLRRRCISSEQLLKFEGYMAEIFGAMGMDLQTPSTEETPQRFIQSLFEATEGYDGDPKLLKVYGARTARAADCRHL